MAIKPTWKGQLRVSLVTVPVKLFPATSTESAIRFNQLHRSCNGRLKQKRWCAACDVEAHKDEIVRGYEYEKDKYVTIGEDELAAVQPESTKIIDIGGFAPAEQLDPMYVDRAYYIAPDGKPHGAALGVVTEARGGRVGIGKLAMSGREHRVALERRGRGLVLFTLVRSNEVRAMDAVPDLEHVPDETSPAEVALASQLMDTMATDIDFSSFEDACQERIRALIDAKIAGEAPAVEPPAAATNVSDLTAALRQSLEGARLRKAS